MTPAEARKIAGRNFQQALKRAHLRPQDLVEALNLAPSSVSNWRLRGVSVRHAYTVADMLGVEPDKIALLPELESRLLNAEARTEAEERNQHEVDMLAMELEEAVDDDAPAFSRRQQALGAPADTVTKEDIIHLVIQKELTPTQLKSLYLLLSTVYSP